MFIRVMRAASFPVNYHIHYTKISVKRTTKRNITFVYIYTVYIYILYIIIIPGGIP